MSDNLASPFTVASMEDQGWKWTEKMPDPPAPPQNYSFANLFSDLRQFGEAYQRTTDQIRQQNPLIQKLEWIQLGASVSHARERLLRIPGFNELRTFAMASWGEEITLPVCRRILGALVQRSNGTLSVADAEKLTLVEAASRLTPPTPAQKPETVRGAEDPFEVFNRVVLAICDEEDREATTTVTDPRFAPMPLLRDSRRMERMARFETAASKVFQAAIAGGIPREEAQAKVKAVAQALETLMNEPWWQRVNIGETAEKEAAANKMCECLKQVHEARQAVFHLGLALQVPGKEQPNQLKRAKGSTEPGEGRAKIIAALAEHHQYEEGSCLNAEPIVANELARLAKVGKATVNRFFNSEFNGGEKGGYANYKRACCDRTKLVHSLKLLLGEVTPTILFKTLSNANELEGTDK